MSPKTYSPAALRLMGAGVTLAAVADHMGVSTQLVSAQLAGTRTITDVSALRAGIVAAGATTELANDVIDAALAAVPTP